MQGCHSHPSLKEKMRGWIDQKEIKKNYKLRRSGALMVRDERCKIEVGDVTRPLGVSRATVEPSQKQTDFGGDIWRSGGRMISRGSVDGGTGVTSDAFNWLMCLLMRYPWSRRTK